MMNFFIELSSCPTDERRPCESTGIIVTNLFHTPPV
jgi:hypothetical protein